MESKPDTIHPGVVIDGRTYYPTGRQWLVAFAIVGCQWAIDALEKEESTRILGGDTGGLSMLVLDRTPGTAIKIGDDITVTVVEVKGNGHVKIGIVAPRDVPVFRSELLTGERVTMKGDK